jgi:hypothetical protein
VFVVSQCFFRQSPTTEINDPLFGTLQVVIDRTLFTQMHILSLPEALSSLPIDFQSREETGDLPTSPYPVDLRPNNKLPFRMRFTVEGALIP